jgi:hypothetical protein
MAIEAGAEVLHDRQEGKDPPILGNVAHPASRHAVGWHLGGGPALEQHLAPAGMDEAHDCLQCRALADAVAPEEAHHLACPYLERDAMQDMALAVVGVNVLDLDEGLDQRGARAHILR